MDHRSSSTLAAEDRTAGNDGASVHSKLKDESGERNQGQSGNDEKEEQPKDEEGKDVDTGPIGFLDPSLRSEHKKVLKGWATTVLILMTFIMAVLSLYWGVLYRVEDNLANLQVAVVSFDGLAPYSSVDPIVGQAVQREASRLGQMKTGVIGFTVEDPSYYDYDPIKVRVAVYSEHRWAAIIVNSNASALLQQAVATGNSSYEPIGAIQVIYNEARQENTAADYVVPQLNQFMTSVQSQFGSQWVQQVLSNRSLDPTVYARAPQALSPAIGASIINLRPFGPPQATQAVSIGLIYLIILSFFSFPFFMPHYIHLIKPEGHKSLHFYQWIAYRLAMTCLAYLFLSLAYSLVSLAYQIPFSNTFPHNDYTRSNNPDAYGSASFVVYWMLNFVGMYALGLASENVAMAAGPPWTGMWLIFWVITNVSSSFYSVELLPGFFQWAYAWPLHQIVYASRTILFDTHSKIGLNFGILFAWCAVNTVLYPFACLFLRYKEHKEEIEKKDESRWKLLFRK